MLSTIGFNDQFMFCAGKIGNIFADGMLSPKAITRQLPRAENLPQARFGLGLVVSEVASQLNGHCGHIHTDPSPASQTLGPLSRNAGEGR